MSELEPLEPIEAGDPVQSTVFVEKILQRLGIDSEDQDNRIALAWPIIVPEFASMSRCVGVRDGKLQIRVSHPSQMSLMRLNSKEIMKKIKAFCPDTGIIGLAFALDQKNR